MKNLTIFCVSFSMIKRLETINTMVSSIWWLIGFYWIVAGGQALLQDAPRLYWLTVVFLAFDVFFIIFCIGMASVVFLAVFCCIPILAVAYAVAIRKGASEDDIRSLPKYKYRQEGQFNTLEDDRKQEVLGVRVRSGDANPINELFLLPEDSVSVT
uniref:RING-type E3 ubiquitin transferase n=2 Tax=Rhizophora mucronata TaxID=61149 RepID=A0A2P2JS93_RHIMU